MAASRALPAVVQWGEVLLIVRDEDRAELRCSLEVLLVFLARSAELGRQVHGMARRAQRAGQAKVDYAVVKVYRYHAESLREFGSDARARSPSRRDESRPSLRDGRQRRRAPRRLRPR